MKKLVPDYSFVRDGKPMSYWLWQLVDLENEKREQASLILQAMYLGVDRYYEDLELDIYKEIPDTEAQANRFAQAVKLACIEQDFPLAAFVNRLCIQVLDQSKRPRLFHKVSDSKLPGLLRQKKYRAALLDQLEKSTSDELVMKFIDRKRRQLAGLGLKGKYIFPEMHKTQQYLSQFSCYTVLNALDEELLHAEALLHELLDHEFHRDIALNAITRIGSKALCFANRLIDDLKSKNADLSEKSSTSKTLGIICRNSPKHTNDFVLLLNRNIKKDKVNALIIFYYMQSSVCSREEEIACSIYELISETSPDHRIFSFGILSLASVGRHLQWVRDRIRSLTSPNPSDWLIDLPQQKLNSEQRVFVRADALTALECFIDYPSEIVPTLIRSMDTFEEPDPDYSYRGPHERIATVLKKIGPAAHGAVSALINSLSTCTDETPSEIYEALVSIGSASKPALPFLLKTFEAEMEMPYHEYLNHRTELVNHQISIHESVLGWTIQQLEQM